MKVTMYTLLQSDLSGLQEELPPSVLANCRKDGYFNLGVVNEKEGKAEILGIAQFYINLTPAGECLSEVTYVYVREEYRMQGFGLQLLERVNRILKKCRVRFCVIRVPKENPEGTDPYDEFLRECGYMPTREAISVLKDARGNKTHGKTKQGEAMYVRLTNA